MAWEPFCKGAPVSQICVKVDRTCRSTGGNGCLFVSLLKEPLRLFHGCHCIKVVGGVLKNSHISLVEWNIAGSCKKAGWDRDITTTILYVNCTSIKACHSLRQDLLPVTCAMASKDLLQPRYKATISSHCFPCLWSVKIKFSHSKKKKSV